MSLAVPPADAGMASYLVPMRSVSPCAEPTAAMRPGDGPDTGDERAARVIAIVESLRKQRRDPEAAPGPELADAQASLERRIRAHLARGRLPVEMRHSS